MIRVPRYFWSVSLQTYQLRALDFEIAAAGALEPVVLVGGVVDDKLGDDPQATLFGFLDEALEILHRPEIGIDVAVVRDVVTVVAAGGRIERQQPQRGDAEILQIAELLRQSSEISDAIVIAVGKGLDVQLIDDGVLVPELVGDLGRRRFLGIDGGHHVHGAVLLRQAAEEQSGIAHRIDPQMNAAPVERMPFAGDEVFYRGDVATVAGRPDLDIGKRQPDFVRVAR